MDKNIKIIIKNTWKKIKVVLQLRKCNIIQIKYPLQWVVHTLMSIHPNRKIFLANTYFTNSVLLYIIVMTLFTLYMFWQVDEVDWFQTENCKSWWICWTMKQWWKVDDAITMFHPMYLMIHIEQIWNLFGCNAAKQIWMKKSQFATRFVHKNWNALQF